MCSKLKLVVYRNIRQSKTVFNRDEVFHNCDDKLAWKGSGQVLNQDGLVVYIRHGRCYINAHSCRVQLTKPNSNNDYTVAKNIVPTTTTTKTAPSSLNQPISRPVSDDKIDNNSDENENFPTNHEIQNTITNNKNINLSKLKPNVEILFTNEDHDSCIAKIINRARKTTGKYNKCYDNEYKTPDNLAGVQTWINTKN